MSISNIPDKFLPNLPGFRPKIRPTGRKKTCFEIVNGQVFLRPEGTTIDDDAASVGSIGNSVVTKARKHLSLDGSSPPVLNFTAYFEEPSTTGGPSLIRIVTIHFYTEDGSIKVVEKPQVNSGVSQGKLIKRSVVTHPDGRPITEDDLHVGNVVILYSKRFCICDCDPATRTYMEKFFNMAEAPPVSVPQDPYMTMRKTMEPGLDDSWGKFHVKMNDNKKFNEALLGNSVDNHGREGFIKYGNNSLKFRCLWDDTQHLYGDVIEFTLQYYLADDTLEINSIPSMLTKDSNRIKLLKKSRLPKDFHNATGLGLRPPSEAFFHWSDFYIGMELEVYGRRLVIVDADSNTRSFYYSENNPLGQPIVRPPPEVKVHEREIPPPTGFGSEEDSLRSVSGSLMPGAPPVKKYGENKMLSFFASLLSGGIDDVDRRFVLSYYVTDNTLKVIEPPVRNSGFTGGVFLSRRAVKKPNGEIITDKDLFVGCKLKVLKHEFLLLDTSDDALRWMEDKGLPQSNIYAILDKIRPVLFQDAQSGALMAEFQQSECEQGRADRDALRKIFSAHSLMNENSPNPVTEHELITILRAAGNKLPHFDYVKFVQQIVRPTDEYK